MGFFERYLSVWVGLCIVAGVGLGYAMPGVFASIWQKYNNRSLKQY